MARELSPGQVDEVKKVFHMMDKNKDGRLSKEEFMDALCVAGMNPTDSEREEIMKALDINKDGFVDYDEFLSLMKTYYIESDLEAERMKEAFSVLDKDKDGAISLDELKGALLRPGGGIDENDVEELFNEIDKDGNGLIEYEEFVESTFCAKQF